MNKRYSQLAVFNLLLGLCAICLYLPYTLEAFDMPGFDWFKFVPDMLKDNYGKVLIYFGIFLLLWIIGLSVLSLLNKPNLPKLLFKISAISALILPLIYVCAFEFEWAREFWVKNISSDIKMISFVVMGVSCGSFVLGLVYNFTRKNRANLHLIVQALVMCALLVLLVAVNNWCGWDIKNVLKLYGVLVGILAIYLPISSIILFMCRKNRY